MVERAHADVMRLHGTETHMGTKLHATFVGAGLESPTMRLEAPVGGMPVILGWLEMFKELIATLLPELERLGLATAALVNRLGLPSLRLDRARPIIAPSPLRSLL
jgi:hypothetical protein